MATIGSFGSRILVADDDQELVALMREFLIQNGFIVGAAHNGPNALKDALSRKYDLVVLDVMMPGFDGFEVLRRLRKESRIPVLMLTARTESQSRIRGLESGADDYLPKPFEPGELVARIRAVLRRAYPLTDRAPLQICGIRLEPTSRRVFRDDAEIDVTSIEYQILEILMNLAGRVVSRDDIAQQLYNREVTAFDRAIDVHISRLRKKLGPRDLIRTMRGVGYQFITETEGDEA
ncbi:MAG: response regulator transcription factor [Acidobacteriota bacterium]